jgi:hypothetical protein
MASLTQKAMAMNCLVWVAREVAKVWIPGPAHRIAEEITAWVLRSVVMPSGAMSFD